MVPTRRQQPPNVAPPSHFSLSFCNLLSLALILALSFSPISCSSKRQLFTLRRRALRANGRSSLREKWTRGCLMAPRPVIVSFAPTSSFTSAVRHRVATRIEQNVRDVRNVRYFSILEAIRFFWVFFPRGKTFFRMNCNRGEIFLFSVRIREITFALFSRQRNFENKRDEKADSTSFLTIVLIKYILSIDFAVFRCK